MELANKLHRLISNQGNLEALHTFAVDVPVGASRHADLAVFMNNTYRKWFSSSIKPWILKVGNMTEDEYDSEWRAAQEEWEKVESRVNFKYRIVVAKRIEGA